MPVVFYHSVIHGLGFFICKVGEGLMLSYMEVGFLKYPELSLPACLELWIFFTLFSLINVINQYNFFLPRTRALQNAEDFEL